MITQAQRMRGIARKYGILIPGAAWRAHVDQGVPFYVLCAFLMQESGGGRNVYGHDVDASGYPRPFWGHGLVTEANYQAYLRERDLGVREPRFVHLGRRSQGVGPMQLTFWAYQDAADAAGGCWNPRVNVSTAASIIRGLKVGRTWRGVALKYNGKESYADQMVVRFARWRDLTGGV